jgi:hypothetical protein
MKRSIVASSLVSSLVALGAVSGCSGAGPESFEPGAASTDEALAFTPRDTHVDWPLKSHVPTPDATKAATLQYYGGSVIANPKVYVVWWGDPSKLNPAITKAHGGIADYFAGITNSSYMDWLNEYDTSIKVEAGSHKGQAGTNQHVGRGNYVGTITLTSIPAGNVTDAQIQQTLDAAFTANKLPQPDADTIYAIYFPSNVSITLDGSTSCFGFGAYHFATTETKRHAAYYLVMPDCGDSFAGVTEVTSHELVEATTDAVPTPGSTPNYPQAWNDSGGNEAGDLCEGTSGSVKTSLGTFSVQGIWDESSQGCKTFRHYAKDYNVSFPTSTEVLTIGKAVTVKVQTATVAGTAQPVTLAITAPAGVTAKLDHATIASGQSANLTVTATAAVTDVQVVVHATGTTGTAAQTHSASLLVSSHR